MPIHLAPAARHTPHRRGVATRRSVAVFLSVAAALCWPRDAVGQNASTGRVSRLVAEANSAAAEQTPAGMGRALGLAHQALTLAVASGDPELQCALYAMVGRVSLQAGRVDSALAYFRLA